MKTSISPPRTASSVLGWMLACVAVLMFSGRQCVAEDADLTEELVPEAWVNQIPPGATRQEVHKLLGPPTGIRVFDHGLSGGSPEPAKFEFYLRSSVYLFKYDGTSERSELVFCGLAPSGAFNETHVATVATCYVRYGNDRKAVEEFLEAGDFGKGPAKPNCLRYSTGMYPGLCYPVGGGRFLNVVGFVGGTEPDLPYANTNYRVSLVTPGNEPKILYRVQDNWAKFKPGQLTEAALADRERKLWAYGRRKTGEIWSEFLGASDGHLKLNIGGEHVYYFRGGLIIFSVSGIGNDRGIIERIEVRRIDGGSSDLNEWLEMEKGCAEGE